VVVLLVDGVVFENDHADTVTRYLVLLINMRFVRIDFSKLGIKN
jgi:hypothetical protein